MQSIMLTLPICPSYRSDSPSRKAHMHTNGLYCLIYPLCRLFLWLGGIFILSPAHAVSEQDVTAKLDHSFSATRPTLSLEYDVSYRLMGLRLVRVATATLEVTEGLWQLPDNPQAKPCFLIRAALQSIHRDEHAKKNGRIYLNDYIISVSERETLNAIYYAKKTDEYINPPLVKAKRIDKLAVYNMERNVLDYFACNYLTGEVQTNLTGAADTAAKGSEVSRILNVMSDVFQNETEQITPDSDFRLHVNHEGTAIPFAAQTSTETLSVLGHKWLTLQIEVMPAAEAPDIDSNAFRMWAAPLRQLADILENPTLQDLSANNPPWDMIPLVADYSLALGSIRCSVRKIQDQESSPIHN